MPANGGVGFGRRSPLMRTPCWRDEAVHDLANPICVAREVHAPVVDRAYERHSIRQQRRPRFEIKPYPLGICTIGRDSDTAAQMKAGVGPVIEDEAKVLVDPGSPFRDQQHLEGRHENVR